MSNFEEIEQGREKHFELMQELVFLATSHAAKTTGLWAAQKLGLSGDDAHAYASEALEAFLAKPNQTEFIQKLVEDLNSKGVKVSRHRIDVTLREETSRAKDKIMQG